MREFTYTVIDPSGIHARPAGLLAKKAAEYVSKITVIKGEKRADTRRLMMLMALSVKGGDEIRVIVEGDDEEVAALEIEKFLCENKF